MQKTVLITGCSSGFGKATAIHFASQGWNVIATMRNPKPDNELAAIDGVFVTHLDVQDLASIEAAVAAGIARFGRIDVLVNNAGFGLYGVFEATSREKVREQFDVNVFGTMDVTRAILPHFRGNKAGVILNISSGAGIFTLPMLSLYSASKFALEGFSEALTYELAPLGITVKLIEPGGVVSTNFGKRSGAEAGQSQAPSDYDAFLSATEADFRRPARNGLGQRGGCRQGHLRGGDRWNRPASLCRHRRYQATGHCPARNLRAGLYRVHALAVHGRIERSR